MKSDAVKSILQGFSSRSRRKKIGLGKIRAAWGNNVELNIPDLDKFGETHIANVAKVAEKYTMLEASQLLRNVMWLRLRLDGRGRQSSREVINCDWQYLHMASEEVLQQIQNFEPTQSDFVKYGVRENFSILDSTPVGKVRGGPLETARKTFNNNTRLIGNSDSTSNAGAHPTTRSGEPRGARTASPTPSRESDLLTTAPVSPQHEQISTSSPREQTTPANSPVTVTDDSRNLSAENRSDTPSDPTDAR